MPRCSSDCCSSRPATSSSWRSISHGITCTTVTSMPRSIRPFAASRPEQPAADHDRVPVRARGLDHVVGVRDVAIRDHALQVLARHRQDERVRAGRKQQPVVASPRCRPRTRTTRVLRFTSTTFLPVCSVMPLSAYHSRVFSTISSNSLLAREHRRQQDAVVVRMRFGAEYGDVVEVGLDLQQLFERAHAGHAVADHHQFHLLHVRGSQ